MIRALLLALALSGCEGQRNACPSCGYPWPIQDSIAQADDTAHEIQARLYNAERWSDGWHLSNPGPWVQTYEYWRRGRRYTVSLSPEYVSTTPVDSFRVVGYEPPLVAQADSAHLDVGEWPSMAGILAQADPTKEVDWPSPGRDYPGPLMMTPEWFRAYMEARGIRPNVATQLPDSIFAPSCPADTACYERREWGWLRTCDFHVYSMSWKPDSLTVTNATPRTLLLEQECVVTLAKPGSTQTVALEGSVTIREEASYDE